MKKFSFSLQKVLNFRSQSLDVLKNELVIVQHELSEIELEIKQLEEVYKNTNIKLKQHMSTGISSSDISAYKIYLGEVNEKIKKKIDEKKKIIFKIEQKQKEIISVNIEIASLDKLKQRQYDEYQKAVQKATEIELDEFMSNLMAI